MNYLILVWLGRSRVSWCIPILWMGIRSLDLTQSEPLGIAVELPLAMRLGADWSRYSGLLARPASELTANERFFRGGLVWALDDRPEHDAGKLTGRGSRQFALFGRHARTLAWTFYISAIGACLLFRMPHYMLMFMLILLMGVEHPPTADDRRQSGRYRTALGYASLLIPIFTFAPRAFVL